MKKGLALLLAASMAVTTFSSAAFAAEEELTVQEKFDALVEAGIFTGMPGGDAAVEENMTRAQVAAVIQRLLGLELDEEEALNDYKDLKWSEWAAGYIGAVSPEIMQGFGKGVFAPTRDVTFEELATILVRALDIEVDEEAEVEGTISDWAVANVAAAIENGLIPEQEDYTAAAPRGVLIAAAYAAYDIVNVPEVAEIASAKAAGVQKVEVVFNKAIDTEDAKLTLKKGTQTIATDVEFADDKQSAILTLKDVKITEGTYTVTLSGVEEQDSTASFTAEDEKVTSLSFVNPSDKIAKSPSVIIKLQAENQYGENASLSAGSYTAYVAGDTKSVTKNEDTGYLELKIDTSDLQSEIDVVPVTVFLTNSSVSAQKTFKVGTEPYVTKIELGEVKYPADKTALTQEGDVAEVTIDRYDQYGDIIGEIEEFEDRLKVDAVITPYSFDALELDKTNSTFDKLKFKLVKNVEKAENYTANVYVGAASASVTIKTESTKVANRVDFGSFSGVLAEGDVDKYIPIVAYDANGNQLSAQEIADNAKDGRFTISISGAEYDARNNGNAAIVQTGEHKGKIHLQKITASHRGIVFVNIGVYSANVQDGKQQSFNVQEARKPATIAMDGSAPAPKAVVGGETKVKWFVKDQHGEELKKVSDRVDANDYEVKVTVEGTEYADFSGLTQMSFNAAELEEFNKKELKLKGKQVGGTAKITVELIDKSRAGQEPTVLKKVEQKLQVIEAKDLTYSVKAIPELFAAQDNDHTPDKNADTSKFGKKIEITAKDRSGDAVAIPGNRVISISTEDPTVANYVYKDDNGYVIGNKAGTTKALVVFKKDDGTSQEATVDLTVKADLPTVKEIKADATEKGVTAGTYNAYALMNLKVVDSYGIEYKEGDIEKYKVFLGVQYVVSDVQGDGRVTVDNTGRVTITGDVAEFVLKAVAPNGISAQTLVTRSN